VFTRAILLYVIKRMYLLHVAYYKLLQRGKNCKKCTVEFNRNGKVPRQVCVNNSATFAKLMRGPVIIGTAGGIGFM
jgi:hypothetical protein